MNAPIRAQQAQQQIEIRHAEPQVGYGAIQGAGAQDPDFQRLLAKPSYDPRHLLYGDSFDRMLRIAEVMASGKITVPPHLRGNTADCLAIVMQAMRWGADPFAVAQKSYVVDGHLGFESQLVGAILNASGAIEDAALKCEYFGPWENVIGNYREVDSRKNPGTKYRKLNTSLDDEKGVGIRVWATLTGESEPRELEFLLTQAGVRNSTLWADDPKQQIFYTAQARWTRRFAPGAILGLFTIDEMGITDRDPDDDLAPPVRGPQRKSSAAPTPPAASAPPPAAAPALPAYADEAFAKNLPLWAKLVADGKKAPGDLLATLATKATFSEEQKARILSLKKAPEAGPAPAAPAAPTPAPADGGEHDDFIGQMDAAEEAAK